MKIEGHRVLIRQLREDDLEGFFSYRSDKELCKYQNFTVDTKVESEAFIKEQKTKTLHSKGEWIQIAVELKSEGIIIGDCAVCFKESEPRIAEIGYTIATPYQRKGYATEAVRLLMKEIFKNHNVHKVIATIDVRNPSSARVLEKIGFKQEGRFHKHFFDKEANDWIDEIQFAFLRDDFMEEIF